MGSFKLAGPDGIKPIVMQIFGPRALGCITNIFQAIYSTGYIPIELRKSRVFFIPKPQKDDYGDAGSFRPISLTQFLFKSMQHVIEWLLREHANKFGIFFDMQHAYSGTRGTYTALIRWYVNFLKKLDLNCRSSGVQTSHPPCVWDPTRWGLEQQDLESSF